VCSWHGRRNRLQSAQESAPEARCSLDLALGLGGLGGRLSGCRVVGEVLVHERPIEVVVGHSSHQLSEGFRGRLGRASVTTYFGLRDRLEVRAARSWRCIGRLAGTTAHGPRRHRRSWLGRRRRRGGRGGLAGKAPRRTSTWLLDGRRRSSTLHARTWILLGGVVWPAAAVSAPTSALVDGAVLLPSVVAAAIQIPVGALFEGLRRLAVLLADPLVHLILCSNILRK